MDSFYYRLGYWVAGHTKATLATSLILVVLCCMGFTSFTTTTDGRSLVTICVVHGRLWEVIDIIRPWASRLGK